MPSINFGKGTTPARLLPGVLWRVLPFTIVALIGIWLLVSHKAADTLSAQLEKALQNEAAAIAKAAGDKLNGAVDALSSLAANDFIIDGSIDVEERPSDLAIFFKSPRLPGSLAARVTLTDDRGRRVQSNAPGRAYDDAPWLSKVMAGANLVDLTRDGLLIAVPVRRSQRPDGVMVMELLSASLRSFLDLSAASRVIEVWNRDNARLYVAPDHGDDAMMPGDESDASGWETAQAVIPGYPDLRLILRQRHAIAFAPAERLDRFMFAALCLSILTFALGMAATAYFATRPLRRFVAELDKIGDSGDFGYRMAPFGSLEFHELSRSLNRMLENLENTTTSRDYFNGVLNSIGEILIVTDAEGRIHLANRAATEITGWSFEELNRRNVNSIVRGVAKDPDPSAGFREGITEAILTTAAGSQIPVQFSHSRLSDASGTAVRHVHVLVDITERKRVQEELAALARYDILTGLANRSLFQARHSDALAHAKRTEQMVALMLLDLDNFKDVNDTLGHPVGDALLIQVARRLTQATRETDTVARLGGDEFAVVLTNLKTVQDAELVAAKLIESLKTPFVLDEHEVCTGVSIGISVFPPEQPDTATMFNHADIALYQSKSKGKGTFDFFDEEMNTERQARKALVSDLSDAIALNQLELHYQPKLIAVSGEVIGVEALIRWRHPERGMVPPMEFIPVAESTGMIIELSAWVLNTACAQHLEWRESGLGSIPIAVNLSAVQFRDGRLGKVIQEILAAHDVEPAFLELEITESTIIDRVDDAIRQLTALHRLGHKIFVDDFGTGYSSLSYLSRLPIDAVKIDRSFISKVTENTHEATITKAIVALAKSLDMSVIAEGVETQEQLTFLRQHGCPEVQGYFFSRPLPAEEFVSWLRARPHPAVRGQIQQALRAAR